ncbi:energy-coupling factor transporter ATPase [Desulfoscipio gibsoniae]|uniref:ABC-type cobalt transport system, ATPase component n=1 Tax=Desulfoscipio gibsoniae DSM 7213 TaxID=767817 RepID=R4KBL6_9FIRM|nr:energy-coupling factor transporter ATPase [Desulfoscipio gibsoniae]AGK99973.1 ABC-type cobalt transport system, ATPase component [Desulfoscipio gibsoniae DSM 7213]
MPCIEVEGLTHIYFPGTPLETMALRDINLTVDEGEFIALAGAAGSGKSTLVQHFNGLLLPTAGSVRVFGGNTMDKKHRQGLWRRVGLVFQFPERQIFSATVFDDIAFGPLNMGWDASKVEKLAKETLGLVGLPEQIQAADPATLSGGILRRVAIAGVLVMRPRVLIMDEPGAGLEPAARQLILAGLKKLQAQHGVTVILITHHLEDAAVFADRVAVLRRGSLLCVGKTREILSRIRILQEAGLKAPFAVELAHRLIVAGIEIPDIPLTIDDAARLLHGLVQTTRAEPGREQ